MTNMNMILPVMTAYVPQTAGTSAFTPDQIVGLPDWAKHDRYDIDAKVSGEDLPEWQKPASQRAMLQVMLQALLVDRCKLAVHREIKEVAVYSLVVGKSGPKLKVTNPDEPHPVGVTLPWGGVLIPSTGGSGLHLYGVTMKSFATVLSQMGAGSLGRTIQDNTGLTGKYDIVLREPDMGPPPTAQPGGTPVQDSRESVFSVVEGFGLKLESTKAPVETLVIDHMERPSEN